FLSYGLVKVAYVATEALGALCMHLTKTIAYGELALITPQSALAGIALSPAMIAGSYLGKRIVHRLPERAFETLIEVVLVIAGLLFVLGRA
ncbi:MAG TPA: TSUP family transporter, partial [Candidatus Aquilonibacter sp.]|nr:TSUP family transporter [Candidatus Aquilonibacter sp.]